MRQIELKALAKINLGLDVLGRRENGYHDVRMVMQSIYPVSYTHLFRILEQDTSLRDHLESLTSYYREQLTEAGFDIIDGVHPIVPIMLYDEKTAAAMAARMMEKGVYVVAFSYPVVPRGKARIRTQVSAAHTKEDIDYIVKCFKEVREELGL